MKTLITTSLRFLLTVSLMLAITPDMNGQILKRLGKVAERAAERTVERRVEKETSEKTDQVLDSILEPGSKGNDKKGSPLPNAGGQDHSTGNGPENDSSVGSTETSTPPKSDGPNDTASIEVYSKFDFVPGDQVLFFDDFSNDFVGDFPSKWNTNGGGELVTIGDLPNKWLKLVPGYGTAYLPDVSDLPEEFTLEFDVMTQGLDKKTSSQSFLQIMVGDDTSFKDPKNYGMVEYPFCQFIDRGIIIENRVNNSREIRNDVQVDLRNTVLDAHHVSVAVNQQRFRLWINEQKLVDVPRLLPANVKMKAIKFQLREIDINKEGIFLSNLKVAEGGVDLRRKLISEGKISTNGILFDSGLANIQPQSMGIIRQISQVLQQENGMNLNIVGHTDADGDEAKNKELSKKRAEAVKNALVSVYTISADRLQTEGRGETEPVGDNANADGKAQNRRVEFIKQ